MNVQLIKGYRFLGIAGFCLLLATGADAAKTAVCHLPPGNPDNIQLINVGGKAVNAHLNHGDYVVTPEVCDGLDSDCDGQPDNGVDCSDGIACTVDTCGGLLGCQNTPDDALCDDNNAATADTCSVATGCENILIQVCGNGNQEGTEQCDDGNLNSGDGCSSTCQIDVATCPCKDTTFGGTTWDSSFTVTQCNQDANFTSAINVASNTALLAGSAGGGGAASACNFEPNVCVLAQDTTVFGFPQFTCMGGLTLPQVTACRDSARAIALEDGVVCP